jgi:hypothetical protein
MANLVTDSPKYGKPFLITTPRRGGIVEAPVNPSRLTGKDRTLFICVIANCDYIVEFLICELSDQLGTVAGDVNTDLLHDHYRFRPEARWRHTRTGDFKTIATLVTKQAFGHLATG